MKRLITIALLLMSCSAAQSSGPLYESSDGWKLWEERRGYELTEPYARARNTANNMGIGVPEVPGLIYIEQDPISIIAFPIIVPAGMSILWQPDAVITIFYEEDGDILTSTSVEFFFCTKYPTPMKTLPGVVISSNDMVGAFSIPNDRIFTTPNDNAVVFARFPFGKEPHTLIKCTVANVQVTRR